MSYLSEAGIYLNEAILGFFLTLVILRFFFQLLRVDFRNPVSQTIVSLTNSPLKFLRQFIPGFYGIDIASLVLIIIVGFIKWAIFIALKGGTILPHFTLVRSVADTLNYIYWIFFIALIVSVILSWVMPYSHNPILRLIREFISNALAPVRRILPTFGVIDFSPIVLLMGLNLLQILVIRPLTDYAYTLV